MKTISEVIETLFTELEENVKGLPAQFPDRESDEYEAGFNDCRAQVQELIKRAKQKI